MATANNPISHHTSHTMGNGASSSNNGAQGNGNSNCNERNPSVVFETSVISPTTYFSNLTIDGTLYEPGESDEGALTEVSSRCSSTDSISRNIDSFDDSDVGNIASEVTSMCPSVNLSNFSIIDSTLREGEQFATAHFDTAQKLRIAQALDDFGVDYIELTSPAASKQSRADCETICKLGLKAKILCHIRCNMDDARIAVQTGVDGINMCIGTSSYLMKHSHGKDMAYITAKAKEVIEYVKSNNVEIRFSGEDSSAQISPRF